MVECELLRKENNRVKIGILGAGTWGIALARTLTNCGHEVMVWSAISSEISKLQDTRRQENLPDVLIPPETEFTDNIEAVCKNKDIILIAVPSVYVR